MASLDLAVIGNCRVAALIDGNARISWFCMPHFDGDPVFCALLDGADPQSGFCDIEVEDLARTEQGYEDNTAILVTRFTTTEGAVVEVTDFAPRFAWHGRHYRSSQIMRRIVPLVGAARIRILCRPRFGYGAETPEPRMGSNHISWVGQQGALRLTTDAPIPQLAGEHSFRLEQPMNLLFGPDESLEQPLAETVMDYLDRTRAYWQGWVRPLSVPFEWQAAVIRAAITLKLCSFEDSGAIVAALTTSIPEAPNSGRCWDYRFCWLRDSYFTVHALNRLGATRTMESYIRFVTGVADGQVGRLAPLYPILPGGALEEWEAPSLQGYRGMGPVRVGNAAWTQAQHDGEGSVILAAAQLFFDQRLVARGDEQLYRRLARLGENAIANAFKPDAGLWEFRGIAHIHTHSAIMCWAAVARLSRIAGQLGLEDEAERWRAEAEKIRRRILAEAWNEELGSFTASLGGTHMDASLLLMQELGFVRADDPRYLGTLAAVEKELFREGMMLRYAHADDFGLPETSFTVCTFWYIDALAAVGRTEEARGIFERLLARRNRHGLFSEDVAFESGELWGNFPQTYSMVGLIVCAMRLSKSWEEAFWRTA